MCNTTRDIICINKKWHCPYWGILNSSEPSARVILLKAVIMYDVHSSIVCRVYGQLYAYIFFS